MRYTLAVHGSPYATEAHQRALAFGNACLAAGHEINRVFFIHDAVYVGLSTRAPLQDERNTTKDWQTFAAQHDVELHLCIANAAKRGVVNAIEADRYELPGATLADGFELVGLGQLIDAINAGDRYLEFPR